MDDIMRKPAFCICENEDTDQLNREADQRLCFRYRYSTFRLLSKSEILTPNCPLWLNGTLSETTMFVFSCPGSYLFQSSNSTKEATIIYKFNTSSLLTN